MSRAFFYVFLILLSACGILEDSDIMSSDDLVNLKLNGIEVYQTTNNFTTQRGAPTKDERVSIGSSVGQLTRKITINWPDLESNAKFRFRSGLTKDIEIQLYFGSDRKIRYAYVSKQEVNYEIYQFEYTGQGLLAKLVTSISQNGIDFLTTTDFFDPPGGFFAIRDSAEPTKKALMGGDVDIPNSCIEKFAYHYGWNSSENEFTNYKQYNYCDKDKFFIDPTGNNASFFVIGDVFVEEVFMGDVRSPSDTYCCNDIYYFHPFLFVPVNYRYRIMYAPDWWEENSETTPGNNSSIKLKFFYVQ